MHNLTDEEIALLKHYRIRERVEIDPLRSKAQQRLLNLGYIEERQGNHLAAEHLFQEALRANPEQSDALLELANLRIKSKQYAEAAELVVKAATSL